MKKATLALALVTVVGSFAHAMEPIDHDQMVAMSISMSPTMLTYAPTYTSEELSNLKKVIAAAHEDIAYFAASEGAIRTAKFNGAMDAARALTGDQQSQDMDLAQAILADLQ